MYLGAVTPYTPLPLPRYIQMQRDYNEPEVCPWGVETYRRKYVSPHHSNVEKRGQSRHLKLTGLVQIPLLAPAGCVILRKEIRLWVVSTQ